jgi:hypothetical protein
VGSNAEVDEDEPVKSFAANLIQPPGKIRWCYRRIGDWSAGLASAGLSG